MRGDKVFQHGQSLAEIGLDRQVDNPSGRVGHEAAHSGQLGDLRFIAPRTRVRHHIDGVQLVEPLHQGTGDLLFAVAPDLDNMIVALLFRDQAA